MGTRQSKQPTSTPVEPPIAAASPSNPSLVVAAGDGDGDAAPALVLVPPPLPLPVPPPPPPFNFERDGGFLAPPPPSLPMPTPAGAEAKTTVESTAIGVRVGLCRHVPSMNPGLTLITGGSHDARSIIARSLLRAYPREITTNKIVICDTGNEVWSDAAESSATNVFSWGSSAVSNACALVRMMAPTGETAHDKDIATIVLVIDTEVKHPTDLDYSELSRLVYSRTTIGVRVIITCANPFEQLPAWIQPGHNGESLHVASSARDEIFMLAPLTAHKRLAEFLPSALPAFASADADAAAAPAVNVEQIFNYYTERPHQCVVLAWSSSLSRTLAFWYAA